MIDPIHIKRFYPAAFCPNAPADNHKQNKKQCPCRKKGVCRLLIIVHRLPFSLLTFFYYIISFIVLCNIKIRSTLDHFHIKRSLSRSVKFTKIKALTRTQNKEADCDNKRFTCSY